MGYTFSYGLLVRNSGSLELVDIRAAEGSSQVASCSRPAALDRGEALSTAGLESMDAQIARQLVVEAHTATGLGEDLTYFEHAIWLSQSRPSDD